MLNFIDGPLRCFPKATNFKAAFLVGFGPRKISQDLFMRGWHFGNVANYLEANCPTKDQQILFLLNLTEFAIPKITGSFEKTTGSSNYLGHFEWQTDPLGGRTFAAPQLHQDEVRSIWV